MKKALHLLSLLLFITAITPLMSFTATKLANQLITKGTKIPELNREVSLCDGIAEVARYLDKPNQEDKWNDYGKKNLGASSSYFDHPYSKKGKNRYVFTYRQNDQTSLKEKYNSLYKELKACYGSPTVETGFKELFGGYTGAEAGFEVKDLTVYIIFLSAEGDHQITVRLYK